MNNDDVKNFVAVSKLVGRRLTDEMWRFVMDNYAEVNVKNGLSAEYRGLPWTKVCLAGSDWKYGSFWICPERMLRRGDTIDEFYGMKSARG